MCRIIVKKIIILYMCRISKKTKKNLMLYMCRISKKKYKKEFNALHV